MPNISKRKLERYERAERVARELRYQLSHAQNWDAEVLIHYLLEWMQLTGSACFDRPQKHKES